MHNITSFMSNLNSGVDAAWGSSEYQYSDMWQDWKTLIESNKLSVYGDRVPAAACKFILQQISLHARELKGSGISEDEMFGLIDSLEAELQRCSSVSGNYKDLLEIARDAVGSANRGDAN